MFLCGFFSEPTLRRRHGKVRMRWMLPSSHILVYLSLGNNSILLIEFMGLSKAEIGQRTVRIEFLRVDGAVIVLLKLFRIMPRWPILFEPLLGMKPRCYKPELWNALSMTAEPSDFQIWFIIAQSCCTCYSNPGQNDRWTPTFWPQSERCLR